MPGKRVNSRHYKARHDVNSVNSAPDGKTPSSQRTSRPTTVPDSDEEVHNSIVVGRSIGHDTTSDTTSLDGMDVDADDIAETEQVKSEKGDAAKGIAEKRDAEIIQGNAEKSNGVKSSAERNHPEKTTSGTHRAAAKSPPKNVDKDGVHVNHPMDMSNKPPGPAQLPDKFMLLPGSTLVGDDQDHDMAPTAFNLRPYADHLMDRDGLDKHNLELLQIDEDIRAYEYDLRFTEALLCAPDLTPVELRTYRMRKMDLCHHIRLCVHKREAKVDFMKHKAVPQTIFWHVPLVNRSRLEDASARAAPAMKDSNGQGEAAEMTPVDHDIGNGDAVPSSKRGGTGGLNPGVKRRASGSAQAANWAAKRSLLKVPGDTGIMVPGDAGIMVVDEDPDLTEDEGEGQTMMSAMTTMIAGVHTTLERKGFWQCRLCTTSKYLLAGVGRIPAQPCKWPLRDTSKMIGHFTEMHLEHTIPERCKELGDALEANSE